MIKDKVALITGASKGIGKATALELARNGAKIAINYNNSEKEAREVLEEIKKIGSEVIMIKADVSKSEEVNKMVKEIVDKFGRIDILVNNSGFVEQAKFEDITEDMWNKIIDINLKGVFNCIKAVLPVMKKQNEGKIINIASIAGIAGSMVNSSYGAAKAGVINMTKTLSKELAKYKINVNAIAPGVTKTDMIRGFDKEIVDKYSRETPLSRIAEAEDIAKSILFFSSPLSDFITGQTLVVDGGRF
jgi:3-oxoacyl-[acyl-carrier protein] reductase